MQINIPDNAARLVHSRATAAGFDDVSTYVAHLILSDHSSADPRGALTDQQLEQSLQQCDRAMAQYEAGEGRDAVEALREVAGKHGLKQTQ
ncbi:MAG: hypothetical protein KDA37_03400 [Planctomycetales bacterium]|nr:hypothetical protein [Planctomycetales bacterium]